MIKHLVPNNDILPHIRSEHCPCRPIWSMSTVRGEQVFFFSHVSYDLMDVCERVGIKTSEVWEIEYEIEQKQ